MANQLDSNEQLFEHLARHLHFTLSVNLEDRKNGELFLKQIESKQGFSIFLLKIISGEEDSKLKEKFSQNIIDNIKLAGSIYFKNFIKCHFGLEGFSHEVNNSDLSTEESNLILKSMFKILIRVSSKRQIILQLITAIAIIFKYNFPFKQDNLLPEISMCIGGNGSFNTNSTEMLAALMCCDSVTEGFRTFIEREELIIQIQKFIEGLNDSLRNLYVELCKTLTSKNFQNRELSETDEQQLNSLFLITQIFYNLIFKQLSHNIEDHISEQFQCFHLIISFDKTLISTVKLGSNTSINNKVMGWLEKSQSRIFDILKLFSERYSDCEQYSKLTPLFLEKCFNLLTLLSNEEKHDQIIVSTLSFLVSCVTKQENKQFFANPQIYSIICERIIFPNIRLRESDIEDFDIDPVEQTKRDLDNSDLYTRRRMVTDLIKGLCVFFEKEISEIIIGFIIKLLNEYNTDKQKNQLSKDAAIVLFIAIVGQEQTERRGVTKLNQYFHSYFLTFFNENIKSDLADCEKIVDHKNKNALGIIKADMIKFVIVFRNHFDENTFLHLFLIIEKYLHWNEYIVHSYAALAIEKMIILKDDRNMFKLSTDKLKSSTNTLLLSLFSLLNLPESHLNEYVIRTITRVCQRSEEKLLAFIEPILDYTRNKLKNISKNPTNPKFNHYLFETISVTIYTVCKVDLAQISRFELILFPIFQEILDLKTCQEFQPYIFQLFGQMIRIRKDISKNYSVLFPLFLNPQLQTLSGNVKPLTSLLIAFLQKYGNEIVKMKQLEPLLGVFQKLLSQRAKDFHAFAIIEAIFENIENNELEKYLPEILRLVFLKLQKDRSERFVKHFCEFFSVFMLVKGFKSFYHISESIQNGIFEMIVDRVLLPNFKHFESIPKIRRRIFLFGIISMMCSKEFVENTTFLSKYSCQLLELVINMLELNSDDWNTSGINSKLDNKASFKMLAVDIEDLERSGQNPEYSRLAFSCDVEQDVTLKYGKDPRFFLAKNISSISTTYSTKICQGLKPLHQDALKAYMNLVTQ